ncbi:NTP pyrophosphohydrolase [Streptomyces sp. JJ66]|uniref:NTP pyrophosphohydrolase n=1 Tax=Streptomyces sp. JJ66 TaxID=2803843 RepID=UPI001C5740CF|nr:NTP pyrophosphohydrolase [Streptomyces sp. JJ66]MBW1600706.1 NTP pyrophosphohydrolase [Streptomyces sp. JJ66]
MSAPALVVVDAANAVGSVPDGWWRDRHGATERLRDRLATALASSGTVAGVREPLELVLVVEGAARRVGPVPGVRVVAAPGSGDDAIVGLVTAEGTGRHCVVVTADRELRRRVSEAGAEVVGPSALPASRPSA